MFLLAFIARKFWSLALSLSCYFEINFTRKTIMFTFSIEKQKIKQLNNKISSWVLSLPANTAVTARKVSLERRLCFTDRNSILILIPWLPDLLSNHCLAWSVWNFGLCGTDVRSAKRPQRWGTWTDGRIRRLDWHAQMESMGYPCIHTAAILSRETEKSFVLPPSTS